MKTEYKSTFYEFLDGQLRIQEIESWIYRTPDLEGDLEEEIYSELIEFNFKDKYSEELFINFICDKVINQGDFLTWKIKGLLRRFIASPNESQRLLNEFYRLCTGFFTSQGQISKGFKFLQNLGFNFLYWMDEGYLRINYGKKWHIEYQKCKKDLPFYHKQLEPIASRILKALNDKEIEILDHSNYNITKELRKDLESKTLFILKHKADDKA